MQDPSSERSNLRHGQSARSALPRLRSTSISATILPQRRRTALRSASLSFRTSTIRTSNSGEPDAPTGMTTARPVTKTARLSSAAFCSSTEIDEPAHAAGTNLSNVYRQEMAEHGCRADHCPASRPSARHDRFAQITVVEIQRRLGFFGLLRRYGFLFRRDDVRLVRVRCSMIRSISRIRPGRMRRISPPPWAPAQSPCWRVYARQPPSPPDQKRNSSVSPTSPTLFTVIYILRVFDRSR